MGNKNSTPQRRNTDNKENQLQYRTANGAVPAVNVPHDLEDVPKPGTRTRSKYPHVYRNQEGDKKVQTQTFESYTTGPKNSQGPAGGLHEYPIPTPNAQFRFDYDRPCASASRVNRQIHPRERANVMGPANGKPLNDPQQTRAAVRVANVDGKNENVVVGVMEHPPGDKRKFQRAPFEPLNREGRQAKDRQTDEKGRSRTYPPRGLDAGFVEVVEQRHQRVNQPTYPKMRVR